MSLLQKYVNRQNDSQINGNVSNATVGMVEQRTDEKNEEVDFLVDNPLNTTIGIAEPSSEIFSTLENDERNKFWAGIRKSSTENSKKSKTNLTENSKKSKKKKKGK